MNFHRSKLEVQIRHAPCEIAALVFISLTSLGAQFRGVISDMTSAHRGTDENLASCLTGFLLFPHAAAAVGAHDVDVVNFAELLRLRVDLRGTANFCR